jgi:hypothetical protein
LLLSLVRRVLFARRTREGWTDKGDTAKGGAGSKGRKREERADSRNAGELYIKLADR